MHKKSIRFPKNYENQLLTIRERCVKPGELLCGFVLFFGFCIFCFAGTRAAVGERCHAILFLEDRIEIVRVHNADGFADLVDGQLSLTQKLLGLFHAGVAEVITERIADLRGENFAEVGGGKACHAGEHFQGKIRICVVFVDVFLCGIGGKLVAVFAVDALMMRQNGDELPMQRLRSI